MKLKYLQSYQAESSEFIFKIKEVKIIIIISIIGCDANSRFCILEKEEAIILKPLLPSTKNNKTQINIITRQNKPYEKHSKPKQNNNINPETKIKQQNTIPYGEKVKTPKTTRCLREMDADSELWQSG